jgi:DNA-binding GntR family transcriptional regulator
MVISEGGRAEIPQRPITPAKRLSGAVYEAVKPRILAGVYKAGERLSVDDLCREFQVSRQPVMDALRRLSGEWLVEIIPQVGCRVTSYEPQAFRDFLGTFGEMEGQLGALAAERRTPEQLARLEHLLKQLTDSADDQEAYRRVNREFHSLILQMADSGIIARLCEQMWDFGDFVYSTLAGSHLEEPELVREALESQARLVQAIRNQNQALARLHMAVWLTGVLATVT